MDIYNSLLNIFDLPKYFERSNIEGLTGLEINDLLDFNEFLPIYENSIHKAAYEITVQFYKLKEEGEVFELEYQNEELTDALQKIRKYQSIDYLRKTLYELTGANESNPELLEKVDITIKSFTVGYIGTQILFLRKLSSTILDLETNISPNHPQKVEPSENHCFKYFDYEAATPPKHLEEYFLNNTLVESFFKPPAKINDYIELLRDEENPILSKDNKIIGKNGIKFCSWVELLQEKGHIYGNINSQSKLLILKQLFGIVVERTLFNKTKNSNKNIEYIELLNRKYSQSFP